MYCIEYRILKRTLINNITTAKNLIANNTYDTLLLTGDFNLRDIDWDTVGRPFVSENSFDSLFLTTLYDNFIIQCVREPTFSRFTGDREGRILDLIITDSEPRMLELESQAPIGTIQTAHSVKFSVGKMERENFMERRNWRKGDL